jgi:hypothetical protein
MKLFLTTLLLLLIHSCGGDNTSMDIWERHESEFVAIVNHLKSGKLQKVYGRAGYEIPDTFKLKAVNGPIVFRETDFTYDSSFSILFRLGFDSSKLLRAYPTIVYTDNSKRLDEYNSRPNSVRKLKNNWYLLSKQ